MRAHENPFSTSRIEEILTFRPEWLGFTWNDIEQRWSECNYRASIIGPHGSGKTTLLDAWAKRMKNDGQEVIHCFLNQEKPNLEHWEELADSRGKIIILDGEEQLSFMMRRKLYKITAHSKGILVTRHSKGKLSTMMNLKPDISILRRCIQEIDPSLKSLPELEKWWIEERGNIRMILLRCYDHHRLQPKST